ncbi:MAG: ATP-binding protein [Ferruginibacter sp.]
MIKKIVILGPESTGKSTLCAQLADHYQTAWVKEYAREYLLANGTGYTFDNLLDVAKGQLALEDRAIPGSGEQGANISTLPGTGKPGLVFIDTNMYVLKVWCEFVFDKCHHWILNQIVERNYDLYLLCDIDLPWVKDELREYPDLATREKLYHHYKDIMVNQTVPWVNIDGNYEERLQKAIGAVDKLIVNVGR